MKKIKEQTQVIYSTKQDKSHTVVHGSSGKTAGLSMDQIVNGDCLKVLSTLPSNSIDLTVFSPPYDGIRDYKKDWTFDF